MSALIEPAQLAQENGLVWLEDITGLDYVRQSLDRLPTRRGRPAFHRDGRMVGYAVLGAGARSSRASGTFLRRVFWLAPHDRDGQARRALRVRRALGSRRSPHDLPPYQGLQDPAVRRRPGVRGDARTRDHPAESLSPARRGILPCSGWIPRRLSDRSYWSDRSSLL